ncbi:hypothetical protein ONE63_000330 [Megalurothrips usitatus]|uniref:G-protein coupled receptors family 2 profile 2 domain-containing protein n=1 Tax=Megalurothrips usitatus TaxID=439358 RepID=A0AAV7XY40_9NEOP|nr:hypothetical protein ONE63_000330 [Megalurothrips usitatus]
MGALSVSRVVVVVLVLVAASAGRDASVAGQVPVQVLGQAPAADVPPAAPTASARPHQPQEGISPTLGASDGGPGNKRGRPPPPPPPPVPPPTPSSTSALELKATAKQQPEWSPRPGSRGTQPAKNDTAPSEAAVGGGGGGSKAGPRTGASKTKPRKLAQAEDKEVEEVEDADGASTRSPKLDVEWLVPTKKVLVPVIDPDADAEVFNDSTGAATAATTASPATETPTTEATTTASTTTEATTTSTTEATTTASPSTSAASTTTTASSVGTATPTEPPFRPIVPKCCPPGQRVLNEKKKCVESPLEFIPPFVEYEEEVPEAAISGSLEYTEYEQSPPETVITEGEGYDIIVGNPCRYGRFRLEPHVDSRDEFYLLANGSLMAPFLFEEPLGTDEFCMDVFPDTENGDVTVLPLICFPAPDGPRRSGLQFILYPIGLLLSVPFLVTTFILYAMTPALRDVHGRALMCQVVCLTVAYLTLAFVQLWGSQLEGHLCFTIACVVQFSFVACFFWLNVMCINTWYNMALRPAQKWCRRTERRRFVLYSMYAWSLPCVLLGVTLVMDLTPTIPSSYVKPHFGVDFCWFQTDRAALPYFYAPVTFLVLVNVVLFALTAAAMHRRRRRRALDASATPLTNDTCYRRHSSTAFRSCLCLFAAMGLNWIMEVVSFYVGGPSSIWYATDVLNCLQGVWTFVVFVLNRPARQEIRARMTQLRARRADRGVEYRVPDTPQIDDFQTVVQRQSRQLTHPTPWQQEIRGVRGLGGGTSDSLGSLNGVLKGSLNGSLNGGLKGSLNGSLSGGLNGVLNGGPGYAVPEFQTNEGVPLSGGQ